MMSATGKQMNAVDKMIKTHIFATAKDLKAAIALVKKAVKAKDSSAEQELLDKAHSELDCMLVRDFSGEATSNPMDVVEIVKNAYVYDDFAVEVTHTDGISEFIYLPAASALVFLKSALANLGQQNAGDLPQPVETPGAAKQDDTYQRIAQEVLFQFDGDVVTMLSNPQPGGDLDTTLATNGKNIFADAMTEALLFAWCCRASFPEINQGCVYDYLMTGADDLLA
jgi:hypothetical protein